jgi:hypothetical protein
MDLSRMSLSSLESRITEVVAPFSPLLCSVVVAREVSLASKRTKKGRLNLFSGTVRPHG